MPFTARQDRVLVVDTPGPAPTLGQKVAAEAVGTALLVAVVVGSGIFAQRLSPGDVGLQLLESSLATAGGLVALILAFGPVSGAHLNPVVSLADRILGGMGTRDLAAYLMAQLAGACCGAVVANLMFELDPVTFSTRTRSSAGLWLGEVVATFGLLTVVLGIVRAGKVATVPFAVAGYVGAAYWFTSSTSFANPAVTVGRTLTDTFAGIGPASAPAFVLAQLVGGVLAVALATYLHPRGRLDPAVATAGVATSRGVPADVMAAGPATASVATGCAVPADPGAARPVLAEEPRCPNPPT